MKHLIKLTVFLSFAAFLFVSCEKDKNVGTLTLSVTDAPIDLADLTGIYITVTEIQYHKNDKDWTTFNEFEGPQTFNLLELTEGKSSIMGSFSLEAGTYTQLRFLLDAPELGTQAPTNPGCYLEFTDNSQVALFVPSGSESGWKGVGAFKVPLNGTVSITADFDARKSVFETGNPGNYILQPTIRLIVDDEAGQIAGGVTNIPSDVTLVIYAYEAGTYTSTEADDPIEELTTRFPNAISSDDVNDDSSYKLAYLAPITYDLVVVSILDGVFQEVLGIVEDVPVESNKTTNQPIDISSF